MGTTSIQLPTAATSVSWPEDFIWLPKPPFSMHVSGQTCLGIHVSPTPSSPDPEESLRCRLSAVSQSYPVRLSPISHGGYLLAGAPFIDSLIFYVSLLHSPTGVFWDHPPSKLLALSPVSSTQSNISSGHCQSLASLSWTSGLPIPISLPCALPSGIYPSASSKLFLRNV